MGLMMLSASHPLPEVRLRRCLAVKVLLPPMSKTVSPSLTRSRVPLTLFRALAVGIRVQAWGCCCGAGVGWGCWRVGVGVVGLCSGTPVLVGVKK